MVGHDLSCYGAPADGEVPFVSFRIDSNDAAGELTLASGTPDPIVENIRNVDQAFLGLVKGRIQMIHDRSAP